MGGGVKAGGLEARLWWALGKHQRIGIAASRGRGGGGPTEGVDVAGDVGGKAVLLSEEVSHEAVQPALHLHDVLEN